MRNIYLLFYLFNFGWILGQMNSSAELQNFHLQGRIEVQNPSTFKLIGPASSVTFEFEGLTTQCVLRSEDNWEHHNYFTLIIDDQILGRYKIKAGKGQEFLIQANTNGRHRVTIAKATEAASGQIVFEGSSIANLIPSKSSLIKSIEFIGDSITCGAQSDNSNIPCNEGQYFDQHNAYLAYGPVLARELNATYCLSSVSGIGIYRNWNDEHELEPILPEVYSNLYLNKDDNHSFENKLQPDIVSICLGTNDMSEGDGKKYRLPFDENKYVQNYCAFIEKLFERYPKTQIVLLSSPMLSGEKKIILEKALKKVQKHFKKDAMHRPILVYVFKTVMANGCTGHPNVADHKLMADQLFPFFQKILYEN